MNEIFDKVEAKAKSTRVFASVDDWIFHETGGVVQSGPFAGMVLLNTQAWNDGNLSTKCLGCYEEELHPFVEAQIARLARMPRPKIVDLGCAEGYYAVGLARRLPNAVVYGVDISEESVAIANKAAEANGVQLRTGAAMSEVMADPDLVVVDVEGFEDQYLNLEHFPSLADADVVVECHDYADVSYTRTLTERFSATHDVDCVLEGARDPNKFPCLMRHESKHRWAAVCEGRPCTMNWLTMTARSRHVGRLRGLWHKAFGRPRDERQRSYDAWVAGRA